MRKFLYILCFSILLFSVCNNYGFKAFGAQAKLRVYAGDSIYCYSYPEIESVFDGYRLKNIDKVVEEIFENESLEPIDAKMNFTPNCKNRFKLEREVYGRKLNKEKLKTDIENTLMMGGGVVRAEFQLLKPKLLAKQLQNATFERATFTTYFSQNHDRIRNIVRASSFINGYTVKSGEKFSFNKVVGERTESRGFKMAKIIINGEYAEGVGGGVCQVSTTLYNSALLSGLEIVEQHRHSLAVSYIEPSFDAMVNSGSSDFCFKNNTELPIFIESEVGNNYVRFRIFGEKNDFEYQRSSIIVDKITAKTELVQMSNLNVGEQIIIKNPINGCKSEGYLSATKNGKVLWNKKIREDSYLAVNGLMGVNNDKK